VNASKKQKVAIRSAVILKIFLFAAFGERKFMRDPIWFLALPKKEIKWDSG
jgi:hypothetical protein